MFYHKHKPGNNKQWCWWNAV